MTSLVPVVMCLTVFDTNDIKQKLFSYTVRDPTLYVFARLSQLGVNVSSVTHKQFWSQPRGCFSETILLTEC